MKTEIPKELLKSGYIGLSGSNTGLSKIIKFFSRSIFSHAFFIIEIEGKILCSEMVGRGLVNTPIEKYLSGNYVIAIMKPLYDISDSMIARAKIEISERSGTRYDIIDLTVLQPIHSVGKWFGKNWFPSKYDLKERRYICSGWVAHLLNLMFKPIIIVAGNENEYQPAEYLNNNKMKLIRIFT